MTLGPETRNAKVKNNPSASEAKVQNDLLKKIGIFSPVPLGLLDLHCFFTSNHFVTLQINRLNYSSVKSNQVLQVEMLFFPTNTPKPSKTKPRES